MRAYEEFINPKSTTRDSFISLPIVLAGVVEERRRVRER